MVPFLDGFQQIQDPCAPESNFIDPGYNYTELYQSWRIFQDPVTGFKLHLFEADGTPVAPQFLVATSPNMLPTTTLRKQPAPPATTSDGLISGGGNSTKRGLDALLHQKRWTWTWGF
jgi:Chaperone for protein-folding within the ER, fungal